MINDEIIPNGGTAVKDRDYIEVLSSHETGVCRLIFLENTPLKNVDIGERLCCAICQALMHRAASLVPCMHSFCSGCISEWHER